MATNKLSLTRDQLASFLQDHEQIRQFERLFAAASELVPTTVQDLTIAAGNADQKAVEALDVLAATVQELQAQLAVAQSQAAHALALALELAPQVQGLQCLPPPREFKRARYGQFYDTTTQTATTINTATPVTFNSTDISVGVYIGTPTSRVYVDTGGVYNFQVSMQFDNASGSNNEVWVWFRKNGTDIPDSAMYLNIQNNQSELLQAFNLLVDMNAGDYLEVMWEVNDLNAQMAAFAATGVHPSIPSIILTACNNIEGVQS